MACTLSQQRRPAAGYGYGCRLLLWLAIAVLVNEGRVMAAEAFAAAEGKMKSGSSICQSLDPSPDLAQFVDPLPFPHSIDLSVFSLPSNQLAIGAYQVMQKLHRDLPPTPLYAFGTSQESASVPGPTLLATRNVPAYLTWANHIDDASHFLTVDDSLQWAKPTNGGVPVVVHLHGAEVHSSYDGHPDAWFTHKGDFGASFSGFTHIYPNEQFPMALWYHDHTIGITRLNVAAGLSGMYIITSQQERDILPVGLPLVIQDKQFYENGTINFPTVGISPDYHQNWCPEYFGDTMLTNGKIWPYFKVLPQAYRFRILNACNARFLVLSLDNPDVPFYQIGTDGGLLPEPWSVSTITMAPAERVDVVIDFSGLANGTSVFLNNSGPTPFPSGNISEMPPKTYDILKFIVDEADGYAEGVLDAAVDMSTLNFSVITKDEKPMSEEEAVTSRLLGVVEWDDGNHLPQQFTLDNRTWEDAVTQYPEEGTTEIWRLMNLRINAHPIHIHLVQFQVLDRQEFSSSSFEARNCSFDIAYEDNGTCFTGPRIEPYEYQKGWKDTVITWPGFVTRVLIRFARRDGSAFGFDPSQGPGYVWHCHIVDHEDNVMMRPFVVVRTTNSTPILTAASSHSEA